MKLQLQKFGTTLVSRQAGREALAAISPVLKALPQDEQIEIDFGGVVTFSPSWADEVITQLKAQYGSRIILDQSDNASVVATLEMLEEIHK